MAANTKARSLEIYTAAVSALEAVGGVIKVDQIEQPKRYLVLRQMADAVIEQTGCSKEAARRNVAKAMRRARHGVMQERWGGTRPGAGWPKGRPRKDNQNHTSTPVESTGGKRNDDCNNSTETLE